MRDGASMRPTSTMITIRVRTRAIGLAMLVVATGILVAPAPVRSAVPPFSDVSGHVFEADIEWLRQQELTGGCGGGNYCPDARVTRAEMASFLVRALDLPATDEDPFSDDEGLEAENDINRLAASGITTGCAAGRYCPAAPVTRAQMASFLARALELESAVRDYFADDDRSVHQGDINRLAESGITGGCGGVRFCIGGATTRGQMAAFLHRALTWTGGLPACDLFPATNVWNRRVDALPVAANSATLVATIGADEDLHPDFGEELAYGIPINVVNAATPKRWVSFDYDDESDAGPYPIPPSPRIEGGSDRHILLWEIETCRLYELFAAELTGSGWTAGSGAIWDLESNALRPDGWTSADAAGLPILPGLVRYEEVANGAIEHAIRFTAPVTRDAHIYPARHHAGAGSSSSLPPMGLRVRLKASFDTSGFGPQAQVILTAMKRYGMILADNGSPWFFTGSSDVRWDDDQLNDLKSLRGSDFEVVDTTGFVNGP
jgi:hypothetical protein